MVNPLTLNALGICGACTYLTYLEFVGNKTLMNTQSLQLDKNVPIIHGISDDNEEVDTDDVTQQAILMRLPTQSTCRVDGKREENNEKGCQDTELDMPRYRVRYACSHRMEKTKRREY